MSSNNRHAAGFLKLLFFVTLIVFNLAISQAEVPTNGPVGNVAMKDKVLKPSDTIKRINADFGAVISGKSPIYAKIDSESPLPADGGTTYFKGDGYKLTVVKSLVQFGGVRGYLYGPKIEIENSLLSGNSNEISNVVFYSIEDLKKLLSSK